MARNDTSSGNHKRGGERVAGVLDSDESIVDALAALPTAHVEQLRMRAELRIRFLREVPLQKSTDVAQMMGVAPRSASATLNRWKAERRLFSVERQGVEHYPAFQFTDDGQPAAAMQEILDIFSGLSDWQVALWFFAPNAWLGNEPPMDVLQRDSASVVRAAGHAVETLEV